MIPLDLLADLPDPHDDEPPLLRSDIADELADHLQCALRREILKDGNNQSAVQRVLDRFGDPVQLARRLWWQAMWSRVMKQRILTGLQWMVSLAAVILAAVVLWQQSQLIREMRTARDEQAKEREKLLYTLTLLQAQSSTKLAEPLENMSSASPPAYVPGPGVAGTTTSGDLSHYPAALPPTSNDPYVAQPLDPTTTPRLKLTFVADKADGPQVSPDEVDLYVRPGWKIHGIPSKVEQELVPVRGQDGQIDVYAQHLSHAETDFPKLEPGRYELKVTLGGLSSTRPILIRDNKPQQMTIVCPSPRKKTSVTVTMPALPEDLQKAEAQLSCLIQELPVTIDGIEWQTPVDMEHSITFDAKTGKPLTLDETIGEGGGHNNFDLSKEAGSDCLVFLPTGTVGLRFFLSGVGDSTFLIFTTKGVVDFPPTKEDGTYDHVLREVKAEGDRWDLKIPEQLLADARAAMKKKAFSPDPVSAAAPPTALDTATPVTTVPADIANSDPLGPDRKVLETTKAAERRPALKLKFVLEKEDGPAVKPTNLVLSGTNVDYNSDEMKQTSDLGMYVFQHLKPDHHRLFVRLDDSQSCSRTFLVRDDKPREMTILCPTPRKKMPVLITMKPLPEALQKARFTVRAWIWPGAIELGESHWVYGNTRSQEVTFDPKTGYATKLGTNSETTASQQFTDFTRTPKEDRVVFLPTGPARFRLQANQTVTAGGVPVFEWPDQAHDESAENEELTIHQIKEDEERWEIELPKEFIDRLMKSLERGTLPTY